jgi:hypothetical protein
LIALGTHSFYLLVRVGESAARYPGPHHHLVTEFFLGPPGL